MKRERPACTSVVIPVRNEESTIGSQLEALSRQDFDGDWEVLVADNGSTDRTRQEASNWSRRLPGFQLLDASGVHCAAHARNIGWRASEGDLIACCDGDDVVDPGWLSALVRASTSADLIGGRLTDTELNPPHRRLFENGRFDQPLAYGIMPRIASANMAIWRDVLKHVGGWDASFLRSEDLELCWRVQAAGFKVALAKDARVAYRQNPSLLQVMCHSFRSGRENHRILRQHGLKAQDQRRRIAAAGRLPLNLVQSIQSRRERLRLLRRFSFVAGWGTEAGAQLVAGKRS